MVRAIPLFICIYRETPRLTWLGQGLHIGYCTWWWSTRSVITCEFFKCWSGTRNHRTPWWSYWSDLEPASTTLITLIMLIMLIRDSQEFHAGQSQFTKRSLSSGKSVATTTILEANRSFKLLRPCLDPRSWTMLRRSSWPSGEDLCYFAGFAAGAKRLLEIRSRAKFLPMIGIVLHVGQRTTEKRKYLMLILSNLWWIWWRRGWDKFPCEYLHSFHFAYRDPIKTFSSLSNFPHCSHN